MKMMERKWFLMVCSSVSRTLLGLGKEKYDMISFTNERGTDPPARGTVFFFVHNEKE